MCNFPYLLFVTWGSLSGLHYHIYGWLTLCCQADGQSGEMRSFPRWHVQWCPVWLWDLIVAILERVPAGYVSKAGCFGGTRLMLSEAVGKQKNLDLSMLPPCMCLYVYVCGLLGKAEGSSRFSLGNTKFMVQSDDDFSFGNLWEQSSVLVLRTWVDRRDKRSPRVQIWDNVIGIKA